MSRSLNLLLLAMVCAAVSGFVAPSTGRKSSNTSLQAESSRRNFVDVAFGAALVGLASPAFALDDLSMPTEQKTKEELEMEERLRRKAELKAKAASPKNYQESLKMELERKKAEKSVSREDKRNALCEELGRGC